MSCNSQFFSLRERATTHTKGAPGEKRPPVRVIGGKPLFHTGSEEEKEKIALPEEGKYETIQRSLERHDTCA
jgi:hypothetical protein